MTLQISSTLDLLKVAISHHLISAKPKMTSTYGVNHGASMLRSEDCVEPHTQPFPVLLGPAVRQLVYCGVRSNYGILKNNRPRCTNPEPTSPSSPGEGGDGTFDPDTRWK